jgi:hypothetical protein
MARRCPVLVVVVVDAGPRRIRCAEVLATVLAARENMVLLRQQQQQVLSEYYYYTNNRQRTQLGRHTSSTVQH